MNISARCVKTVAQRLLVVLLVVAVIAYKVAFSDDSVQSTDSYGGDVRTERYLQDGEEENQHLLNNATYLISNKFLSVQLRLKPGGLYGRVLEYDKVVNHVAINGSSFSIQPHLFMIGFEELPIVNSSKCRLDEIGMTKVEGETKLSANFTCVRIARVEWWLTLDDNQHFFRSFMRYFVAKISYTDPVHPRFITLLHATGQDSETLGSVQGSPLFNMFARIFAAFEHPISSNGVLRNDPTTAVCGISELAPQERKTFSRVYSLGFGVYSEPLYGRRAFVQYIEKVRSRPARSFLHYNSWFDFLSWQEPKPNLFPNRHMSEATCLDRVRAFGDELVRKRGVVLDSYLWDDGWDNHSSLWNFHQGFPEGFSKVKALANTYGSGCGVWMSPWGGYGSAKWSRLIEGHKKGFEISDNGFLLSGAKYFQRFRSIALQMVRQYSVNMFKFDGVNFRNDEGGGYAREVEAMMRLLVQLRNEADEDIFINLTTGTWPSPFWLMYADSIWRGYSDLGLFGHGSNRQQWVTYRDAVVYALVVHRAQMFPIHALMLHGIVVGAVGESRALGTYKTSTCYGRQRQ